MASLLLQLFYLLFLCSEFSILSGDANLDQVLTEELDWVFRLGFDQCNQSIDNIFSHSLLDVLLVHSCS